ncbi:MAG: hypothetical protein AMXMBFR84_30470 [Candidatus Hydrogenedentota bacterium]
MNSASTATLGRWILGAGFALVVLALSPLTQQPALDIKFLLGSCVAAIAVLLSIPAGRCARPAGGFIAYFVFAFLAWAALSVLQSPNRGIALNQLSQWLLCGCLFYAARQLIRTRDHFESLITAACGAIFIASIYGFMQKTGYDPFPWGEAVKEMEEYRNLPATYGNPNLAGHALVLAIPLAVYLCTRHFWMVLLLPVYGLHLYWTHQRGGVLAMAGAVALLVIAATALRLRLKPGTYVATTIGSFGVLVAATVFMVAWFSIGRYGTPLPPDSSMLLRYNAVQGGAEMILQKPLTGWGLGSYAIQNPPFWTPFEEIWFATEGFYNEHVHCEPMEFAIEMGFPGVLAYLGVLLAGSCTALSLAHTPANRTLGLSMAAFFTVFGLDSVFGFNAHAPVSAMLFFMVAGALDGIGVERTPFSGSRASLARLLPYGVAFVALLLVLWNVQVFRSMAVLKRAIDGSASGLAFRSPALFATSERITPWHWQAPFEYGRMLARQHKYDEAETALGRALEDNPNFVLAHTSLGRVQLDKAQTLDPNTPEFSEALAAARESAEAAIAMCAPLPEAHELLADVALAPLEKTHVWPPAKSNDASVPKDVVTAAEKHVALAIANYPESPEAQYAKLVDLRLALGDSSGSESAILRFIDAYPSSYEVWKKTARCIERIDSATRLHHAILHQIDYFQGIRSKNDDPALRTLLSGMYWCKSAIEESQKGDYASAEASLRRSVAIAPSNPDAWRAYSRFALRHNQHAAFKRAIRLARDSAEAGLPVGVAALSTAFQGGTENLLKAATEAAQAAMQFANRVGLANAAEPVEAEVAWVADWLLMELRQLSTDDSAAADLGVNLGVILAIAGRTNEAVTLFDSWNPRLPANDQNKATTYWHHALMRENRFQDAAMLARQALEKDPQNVTLMVLEARSLTSAGSLADAASLYEKILATEDLDPQMRGLIEAEWQSAQ